MSLFKSCIILSIFIILSGCDQSSSNYKIKVFGSDVEVSEVERLIIESSTMQRIRHIDQSGPSRYFFPNAVPGFSRFDHSIGVWYLVKKFSGSDKECYAALLHDASFPAFSHMTDYLMDFLKEDKIIDQNESFQDRTHINYLKKSEVYSLLNEKFGLSLDDLNFENASYKCLEQKLPDMCADRIEYNIHTGLVMKKITLDQAKKIIQSLRFVDGKWFFTDFVVARNFAELSLYFTPNFWSSKFNFTVMFHFAEAIRIAIRKGCLNICDIYLTDIELLKKLEKCMDEEVQIMLTQSKNPEKKIVKRGYCYKKFPIITKFRGINPLVLDEYGEIKRLTELDVMFKNYYDQTKELCKKNLEIDRLCKE